MLGKNLPWVAKQHGHSVEVMLRMYAAWLEGAQTPTFSRSNRRWIQDPPRASQFPINVLQFPP
jgi:hypothetical protein